MKKNEVILSYELKGDITGFENDVIEVVGGAKKDKIDDVNLNDMLEDIREAIENIGIEGSIEFKLTLKEVRQ